MNAYLRKRKSETVNLNLRENGNFRSNQSVAWDEIEDKYRRMASEPSPTMAMADLYESYREAAAAYQSSFRPVTNQTLLLGPKLYNETAGKYFRELFSLNNYHNLFYGKKSTNE